MSKKSNTSRRYTAEFKRDAIARDGKRYRTVQQQGTGNRWVSVGAFLFDGPPKVRLTSETPDGSGDQDIAYDAIAVVPVNGTYKEHSVEAVALFDKGQNIDGDTASSWIVNSPFETRQKLYDWGLGLAKGVADLAECSGTADPTCVAPRTRQAMAAWKQMVLDSGTDPVDHPDGKSLPRWIGFANPYTDRPTSTYAYAGKAATLTDDNQCVAALYTSGGSIGYRPMLGAKSASTAMDRWQQQVYDNRNIHPAVNKERLCRES